MTLLAAAACAAAARAPAAGAPAPLSYAIDTRAAGRRLDGFGAISGGGATSRLLFQYPEPYLTDILDFLFLPSHGAALHHLKVEIGGDGQSSEGTEPSHAHFEGDANFSRGYEWRLMVEARRRNPSILISALAWTWPAWVGAGSRSPWTDPPRAAAYVVAWLAAARDVYNVTADFVDADWNERGWSPAFVLALRAALDAAGFARVGIVCGDDAHKFACAAAAAANATLRGALVALGVHGPDAPDAVAVGTGVPLWGSEVHVTDPGGSDMATVFANLYATFNVTGYLLWNAVSSYNPSLFSPDWGIFRAWWPWTGHYDLDGKLWVFAHWTQATAPGWRFIAQAAGGAGALAGGGQWTALVDAPSGGFTLILSKPAAGAAEVTAFALAGPAAALTSLHAVRSRVVPGGDLGRNLSDYFVAQPDVVVTNGAFSVPVAPGDMWTISTVATMAKGAARGGAPPPATPFPAAFADDFSRCVPPQEAAFWTDMTGVFECASDNAGGGVVMRQVVPAKPLEWRNDEQRPFSVFAADAAWAAADITIKVRAAAAADGALVGVRANPNNCCGRVISGEDLMPGAWLALGGAGAPGWTLYNAIANVSTSTGVLARGPAPALAPGEWHTVRVAVTAADELSAWLDGAPLFAALDVHGAVPPTGFVGIGTLDYGMYVDFAGFSVAGARG